MAYKLGYNFIILIFLSLNIKAQNCKVAMEAISGKYEGECKKDKADGLGKSVGVETYEGQFKGGLPDGIGKYIYKNGNWYEGQWSKGKKEGMGKMLYKLNDRDSLINGFWKKDGYVGKFEKPYIIHYKTVHITRLTCQRQNNTLNQIEISVDSETGGMPDKVSGSSMVAKPEITDITVNAGNFERKMENSIGKKIVYTLQEVTFPFRAVFTMGNESLDLEILEDGKWLVDVRLAY